MSDIDSIKCILLVYTVVSISCILLIGLLKLYFLGKKEKEEK